MEYDRPVHKGFLSLPPGKSLLKKTWQPKYCLLFKASKFGIERLEIYDSTDTSKGTPNIITLENAVKISPTNPTNISITLKNPLRVYEFGTENTQVKNEWLDALQSVAFSDDTSKITSIEEDNDLYCSTTEGIFNIQFRHSSAAQRCGLENKIFTLVLTSSAIQLKNPVDGSVMFTWPYCYIRRYGYKSGQFAFFVAGRMCDSGEGTFFVEHSNEKDIFRCLASKINTMKKMVRGDANNAPILDCGDNQFQAALSMEARSRSPLPPSPMTSTTLHDVDTNFSNKSLSSIDTGIRFPLKPKPTKPPRKTLQKSYEKLDNLSSSTISEYEMIDKYDEVTYRYDAWRTLGVDEVKHTENKTEDEEEVYMSWGASKINQERPQAPFIKAPKIITESTTTLDDDYDKLNFFGSSSKLNANSSYKQVSPAPQVPVKEVYHASSNDYDEVQPALEGIRLADDSHLGYAVIRKEQPKDNGSVVNHQFHNNEPYAVISKPKRV